MHLERSASFQIPPPQLWNFVANTDRLNREVGLPPVTFTFVPLRRGGTSLKARARYFGMVLEWDEEPFEWVWPRFLSVRRRFSRGPMREFRFTWTLEPEGSGTRLKIAIDGEPRGFFSGLAGRWAMSATMNRMFEASAAFERHLAKQSPTPYPGRYGVSIVNRSVLESAARRLSETPVDPKQVKLLARLIEEEVDERVTKIRPFEVADAWGLNRIEVLRLCLHATRAGLLSLKWSIACPRCHGAKARHDSLKEVGPRQSCESCAITFDVDLEKRVEVTFAPHPSIRDASPATYCFGGPMNTPYIFAQFQLAPGETRVADLTLADGAYRLGWDGPGDPIGIAVEPGGRDAVEAAIGAPGAATLSISSGGRLTVNNGFDSPVRAFIERPDMLGARATAARVTSLPEFRGLFDAEVLADGVELSVGSVTLLFSDLKGSTAMYERIGDAPAWGHVKRHFDFMAARIGAHRGAIVKTMGDAVMAVFADPQDAVRCAMEIQRDARGSDSAIKIGIHFGPCLAVTADGRLDYFGSTVNLAQRTQSQSAGGDVVISDALRRIPGMEDVLGREQVKVASFTASLRGLDGQAVLHRLTPGDGKTMR